MQRWSCSGPFIHLNQKKKKKNYSSHNHPPYITSIFIFYYIHQHICYTILTNAQQHIQILLHNHIYKCYCTTTYTNVIAQPHIQVLLNNHIYKCYYTTTYTNVITQPHIQMLLHNHIYKYYCTTTYTSVYYYTPYLYLHAIHL
jgi:hypothetical protein